MDKYFTNEKDDGENWDEPYPDPPKIPFPKDEKGRYVYNR